ncbi:MAG TPA: hypothetical protein VHX86_00745 [Tepidisphaeraceae bacterium]|jgi:PHD/YefM family antitoxin component YafN of YafNO toxin-antitoxin module|nr:hypothetical protein [Tepidisphaeraceae bacterium]
MKTITLKENFTADELLKQAGDEEVVVMRNGHPVALLAPFDDDDLSWYVRERDPAFIESIARAREQISGGDTISIEDLKRELGME